MEQVKEWSELPSYNIPCWVWKHYWKHLATRWCWGTQDQLNPMMEKFLLSPTPLDISWAILTQSGNQKINQKSQMCFTLRFPLQVSTPRTQRRLCWTTDCFFFLISLGLHFPRPQQAADTQIQVSWITTVILGNTRPKSVTREGVGEWAPVLSLGWVGSVTCRDLPRRGIWTNSLYPRWICLMLLITMGKKERRHKTFIYIFVWHTPWNKIQLSAVGRPAYSLGRALKLLWWRSAGDPATENCVELGVHIGWRPSKEGMWHEVT